MDLLKDKGESIQVKQYFWRPNASSAPLNLRMLTKNIWGNLCIVYLTMTFVNPLWTLFFLLLHVNLQGKRVGTFLKDKFPGDFMNGWREAVGAADAEQVRD